MGIRFLCPHCNKRLNVKTFLAGQRGFCPKCGGRIQIPTLDQVSASLPMSNAATPTEGALLSEESSTLPTSPISQPRGSATRVAGPAIQNERSSTDSSWQSPVAHAVQDVTSGTQRSMPREQSETVGNSTRPQAIHSTQRSMPPEQSAPVGANAFSEISEPLLPSAAGSTTPPGQISVTETAGGPHNRSSPALDILYQLPEAVWFVRSLDGQQYGPASARDFEMWLNEGRVQPGMFVWREGWPAWRLARDVFPPSVWSDVPPPPPAAVQPASVSSQSVSHTLIRYQRRKQAQKTWWMISVVILSVLAVVLTVALVVVIRRSW